MPRSIALLLTLAALSTPAAAQEEPAAAGGSRPTATVRGTWAAGVDLGFANPMGDDDFDAEPLLGGYVEYFATPSLSWRGMLSVLSFDDDSPSGSGGNDLDIFALTADALYHWNGGTAVPFVAGGVGLYNYDPDFGDSGVEVGFGFGGGADFRIADRFGIKLEGKFHGTTGREPDSFFVATAGARWTW